MEERTAPATDLASEDLRNMKAVFSSLNLHDDETSNEQPSTRKGKVKPGDMAVASGQEWTTPDMAQGNMQSMGEGDAYQLGFDDGQGYWGGDQSGGAFGIPKQRGYQ